MVNRGDEFGFMDAPGHCTWTGCKFGVSYQIALLPLCPVMSCFVGPVTLITYRKLQSDRSKGVARARV